VYTEAFWVKANDWKYCPGVLTDVQPPPAASVCFRIPPASRSYRVPLSVRAKDCEAPARFVQVVPFTDDSSVPPTRRLAMVPPGGRGKDAVLLPTHFQAPRAGGAHSAPPASRSYRVPAADRANDSVRLSRAVQVVPTSVEVSRVLLVRRLYRVPPG